MRFMALPPLLALLVTPGEIICFFGAALFGFYKNTEFYILKTKIEDLKLNRDKTLNGMQSNVLDGSIDSVNITSVFQEVQKINNSINKANINFEEIRNTAILSTILAGGTAYLVRAIDINTKCSIGFIAACVGIGLGYYENYMDTNDLSMNSEEINSNQIHTDSLIASIFGFANSEISI
jgi:hypothetical protein